MKNIGLMFIQLGWCFTCSLFFKINVYYNKKIHQISFTSQTVCSDAQWLTSLLLSKLIHICFHNYVPHVSFLFCFSLKLIILLWKYFFWRYYSENIFVVLHQIKSLVTFFIILSQLTLHLTIFLRFGSTSKNQFHD